MPIEKTAVQQAIQHAAEKSTPPKPVGIAALVAGIHRGELGDFLTIESTILPPVPLRASHAVGAVVVGPAGGGKWAPWALVTWSWPGGAVLRRERLPTGFGRGEVAVTRDAQALGALFRAAEAFLDDRAQGASLRPLYGRLLNSEGIRLLATAFPESASILGGA